MADNLQYPAWSLSSVNTFDGNWKSGGRILDSGLRYIGKAGITGELDRTPFAPLVFFGWRYVELSESWVEILAFVDFTNLATAKDNPELCSSLCSIVDCPWACVGGLGVVS